MNKTNWRIVLLCMWLLIFIQSPILWLISTILLFITGFAQRLWNSPWGVPEESISINENHNFNFFQSNFNNTSEDEFSDINEIPSVDDAFSTLENPEHENNQIQISDDDIPSPF